MPRRPRQRRVPVEADAMSFKFSLNKPDAPAKPGRKSKAAKKGAAVVAEAAEAAAAAATAATAAGLSEYEVQLPGADGTTAVGFHHKWQFQPHPYAVDGGAGARAALDAFLTQQMRALEMRQRQEQEDLMRRCGSGDRQTAARAQTQLQRQQQSQFEQLQQQMLLLQQQQQQQQQLSQGQAMPPQPVSPSVPPQYQIVQPQAGSADLLQLLQHQQQQLAQQQELLQQQQRQQQQQEFLEQQRLLQEQGAPLQIYRPLPQEQSLPQAPNLFQAQPANSYVDQLYERPAGGEQDTVMGDALSPESESQVVLQNMEAPLDERTFKRIKLENGGPPSSMVGVDANVIAAVEMANKSLYEGKNRSSRRSSIIPSDGAPLLSGLDTAELAQEQPAGEMFSTLQGLRSSWDLRRPSTTLNKDDVHRALDESTEMNIYAARRRSSGARWSPAHSMELGASLGLGWSPANTFELSGSLSDLFGLPVIRPEDVDDAGAGGDAAGAVAGPAANDPAQEGNGAEGPAPAASASMGGVLVPDARRTLTSSPLVRTQNMEQFRRRSSIDLELLRISCQQAMAQAGSMIHHDDESNDHDDDAVREMDDGTN